MSIKDRVSQFVEGVKTKGAEVVDKAQDTLHEGTEAAKETKEHAVDFVKKDYEETKEDIGNIADSAH